jgi:hypothetical protein
VVDAAIRDGKPIPKTLRDHYITRHAAEPGAVEKELAGLPSLHAGGVTKPPGDASGGDPDPVALAAAAVTHQREQAALGNSISTAEAVMAVRQKETAK